jgi:hypothetical protein
MLGDLTNTKFDDVSEKIEKSAQRLNHPDLEVLDSAGKKATRMPIEEFKKKNFLGLISTIPLVIGLIAGIVLAQTKQHVQKKALESVKVSAAPRCVGSYVVVDIDVFVNSGSYEVVLYPETINQTFHLGNINSGEAKQESIKTMLSKIDPGSIEYTLTVGNNTVQYVTTYEGLDCSR